MNRQELLIAAESGWRRTLALLVQSLPTKDGLRKASKLYAANLRKTVRKLIVDMHKETR